MMTSNFNNTDGTNCWNNFKSNNNNDSFHNSDKLLMINKRNYLDSILKFRMKNINLFNQNININNKNNLNENSQESNKDKNNQSTQDDLEKLLQFENDYSFSISELEAI